MPKTTVKAPGSSAERKGAQRRLRDGMSERKKRRKRTEKEIQGHFATRYGKFQVTNLSKQCIFHV